MRGINREMNPFGKYGDLLRRPNGRPMGTQGIPQMQPRIPRPGMPPGLTNELPGGMDTRELRNVPPGGMQPPMTGRGGVLPPQFGGGFQRPPQPMQPPQAVPGGGGLGLGGMPRMMGMQPQVRDMMRRRGFDRGGYGSQFGGMV